MNAEAATKAKPCGPVARIRRQTASADVVAACATYAASVRYQDVTLEALCAVSGVSERRVRDAFYDCHRVSPTVYLRHVALREERAVLAADCTRPDAVTRSASDFGFWHLSRFAGQYRALFGETPSQTVHRARVPEDEGSNRF